MSFQREYHALNRGLVSPEAFGRMDLKRLALACEECVNFSMTTLGPMRLRPGLQLVEDTYDNEKTIGIPFVYSADDTAQIQVSETYVRFMVDDELITRPVITAALTNGSFATDLTGWTGTDEAGGTSAWQTGGYLGLTGNGTDFAGQRQAVTINETNQVHALRLIVERGPIILRVGSTSGAADLVNESDLGAGDHSIAFTPTTSTIYVELRAIHKRISLVTSIAFEGGGPVALPSPWTEDDFYKIRYDQSGDVVFTATQGMRQYKIERRANDSWSIVKYLPTVGPYSIRNTSTVTITPSAISGNITLTANKSLFRSTNVGALFTITSEGQLVTDSITAQNDFTSNIEVTGVDEARRFSIEISGTFSATVTLQRSPDGATSWTDLTTWTAAAAENYNDDLDNQIWYYRVGVKTGNYTSGTVVLTLHYPNGSITGHVRITGYTSEILVDAEVLTDLGGTTATDNWSEGVWSDRRGWPSSVAIHEGRLWFAGKDKYIGSVTDQYYNFDPDYEGDAGPVQRSIGAGPVDVISWLSSAQRLLSGTDAGVVVCRSTSFDEPLTGLNFKPKYVTTQASARVGTVKMDDSTLYVQRNGMRLLELSYDFQRQDYTPTDLSELIPQVGDPGFIQIAIQRQPETRVHCLRSDGTVAVLAFNKAENLLAWSEYETDGEVESMLVLPGSTEDTVYYYVLRTVSGANRRHIEKFALETECEGGEANKQADSFVYYSGVPTTSIGSLGHLEGAEVVCWGDGADLGTFTVSSGSITLTAPVSEAVVGLGYRGRWKSLKMGLAVSAKTRTMRLGVMLRNTHQQGLTYGRDFDNLDPLPSVKDGEDVDDDTIHTYYDSESFAFGGVWESDSRLCLEANAPRPVTVMAVWTASEGGRA